MEPSTFIQGCIKHNLESQRDFFNHYCQSMTNLCLRYSKSESHANELLTACFTHVLKNIKKYNPKTHTLDFWVKSSFIEHIILLLKEDKAGWLRVGTVRNKIEKIDESENQLDYMTEANLIESLQSLPPAYRAVYNLFVIDEFTIEQICDLLDTSILTVETNLAKARFELKRNLLKPSSHGISLH